MSMGVSKWEIISGWVCVGGGMRVSVWVTVCE